MESALTNKVQVTRGLGPAILGDGGSLNGGSRHGGSRYGGSRNGGSRNVVSSLPIVFHVSWYSPIEKLLLDCPLFSVEFAY